tara:strand:- start:86 stop:355 length:270 start_codon:yes stop_codon:yes gene_type:complete
MDTATKPIQEVLKHGDYGTVNIKRVNKHSEAQRLQTELNIAIKKVAELNEAQQQAQFDYECLDAKLISLKAKHMRIKEIDAKHDIKATI